MAGARIHTKFYKFNTNLTDSDWVIPEKKQGGEGGRGGGGELWGEDMEFSYGY